MKVMKFEGTPEEFRAVAYLFGDSATQEQLPEEEAVPTVATVDAIRAMLTRRPISNGQRAVYAALADGRIEYDELLARTDRPGEVMAGVLGALGRRINNTPEIRQAGLPGNVSAIMVFETVSGTRYVELTPEALEALEEEEVI